MIINEDDRPTRAECERDEQGRKPYVMTEAEAAEWAATDPWSAR
jgi:hypothetical protein